MRVRMRVSRAFQDAGQERPLSAGEVYDLPDGVARALIATLAATRDEALAPEVAAMAGAPETAERRRRR